MHSGLYLTGKRTRKGLVEFFFLSFLLTNVMLCVDNILIWKWNLHDTTQKWHERKVCLVGLFLFFSLIAQFNKTETEDRNILSLNFCHFYNKLFSSQRCQNTLSMMWQIFFIRKWIWTVGRTVKWKHTFFYLRRMRPGKPGI